jgi:hypothetical protein
MGKLKYFIMFALDLTKSNDYEKSNTLSFCNNSAHVFRRL